MRIFPKGVGRVRKTIHVRFESTFCFYNVNMKLGKC